MSWPPVCQWPPCGLPIPLHKRSHSKWHADACKHRAARWRASGRPLCDAGSVASGDRGTVATSSTGTVSDDQVGTVALDEVESVALAGAGTVAVLELGSVAEDLAGTVAPRRRRSVVSALYVDRLGVYPELLGAAACWPVERDARGYAGPGPVVAHPPCAPWSRARALAHRQDPDLAISAVGQVRRWGGVLEHPAHSLLWARCGLPLPGFPPDEHGGVSLAVDQYRWGHPALKPTWLYFVRACIPPIPPSRPGTGAGVFELGSVGARRTPPAFAAWLVQAAGGNVPSNELMVRAPDLDLEAPDPRGAGAAPPAKRAISG